MAEKWQMRTVTGKGFTQDEDIQAWEGLSESDKQDLRKDFPVGDILAFLPPAEVEKILERKACSPEDLDKMATYWEGKPLDLGSVYIVIDDPEKLGDTAAGLLKKFKVGDRVVQAKEPSAFSDSSAAEARKNVAKAKAPEGGVWGSRKPGDPRLSGPSRL